MPTLTLTQRDKLRGKDITWEDMTVLDSLSLEEIVGLSNVEKDAANCPHCHEILKRSRKNI